MQWQLHGLWTRHTVRTGGEPSPPAGGIYQRSIPDIPGSCDLLSIAFRFFGCGYARSDSGTYRLSAVANDQPRLIISWSIDVDFLKNGLDLFVFATMVHDVKKHFPDPVMSNFTEAFSLLYNSRQTDILSWNKYFNSYTSVFLAMNQLRMTLTDKFNCCCHVIMHNMYSARGHNAIDQVYLLKCSIIWRRMVHRIE